jgi:uncharacterized membrane protein
MEKTNTNKVLNWIGIIVSIIVGIVVGSLAWTEHGKYLERSFWNYFEIFLVVVITATVVFLIFFVIKLIIRAFTKRKKVE